MSFFPSPEPLSASPDPKRYEQVLQRAAAGAFNHGDDAPAWSIDDAAAFWLTGWEPPTSEDEGFPADMVMAMTTRAFLWMTYELPPINQFFSALGQLRSAPRRGIAAFDGISAHAYCQAAHQAYAPTGNTISDTFHWVGFRALAEKKHRLCNLPECQESESLLRHCLPRAMFDNAMRSGLLRPSRSIDASPLTLLITPLACWRHSLPYIAVREGDTHVKHLYCPYWVHDAITTLARIIPPLLADADQQILIRAAVAKTINSERTDRAERPKKPTWLFNPLTGIHVQRNDFRVRMTADLAWRCSGAMAGWASMWPGMLDPSRGNESC